MGDVEQSPVSVAARGDKPRKIVICSHAEYPSIQRAVAALGHGDVLVKPSHYVDDGKAYVMDPTPEVLLWTRQFPNSERPDTDA